MISFLRATPPALPLLGESVRSALSSIASGCDETAEFMRQHRFDGTAEDKDCAARWLAQRHPARLSPDRIVMTNGTMNSLLLLFATLVGPGGTLATEAMTFPQVRVLAQLFGIQVMGIACDESGMLPDALVAACASSRKPTAVYCNPTIHSPTATIMPLARRREIVEVARRHGVILIEDEAQALYAEQPPPPLANLAPELTWYLMGLSKYLSLGIRAAFVLAPSEPAAKALLARVRTLSTWHPAPAIANIVARWIRDETAHRIFAAARQEIHARQMLVRDVFHDLRQFRGSLGLHFWLEAPPGCSAELFTRAANDAGVLVRPSDLYSASGERVTPGVRPAIGDHPTREVLLDGLRRLRSAFDRLHQESSTNKGA